MQKINIRKNNSNPRANYNLTNTTTIEFLFLVLLPFVPLSGHHSLDLIQIVEQVVQTH